MTSSGNATSSAARPVALLFAAWFVALSASLAVIFIGEVLGQSPFNLCWFQRAFMFPLAVILGVAAWRADLSVWRYATPLAALGAAVALYHSLLYAGTDYHEPRKFAVPQIRRAMPDITQGAES